MKQKIIIPVRFLTVYAGIVTLVLLFFILGGFQNKRADEISVKRINIVNEDGTPALVIANPNRTPPPILKGQEFKRAVAGSGIILYNTDGNERGGVVVTDNEEVAMNAMVLDYRTTDAIGIFSRESIANDDHLAMLSINDPDKDRKIGYGVNRLTLGTNNGNAGLTINGPDGKPRLLIQVDSLNKILFHTLDEHGKVLTNWMD